jgi:hypothetical protein
MNGELILKESSEPQKPTAVSRLAGHDPCSKIKMKCPDCGEVTELYDYLIDKILQAPEPGIPSVEVLSISPRDPNPDPNARSHYWQKVWSCREARYRLTYRPTK